MVTSHPSGPILVLVVCFSLLSLPSDGATVYGLRRPLDEGGEDWGVEPQSQQQREGENSIYSSISVPSSSSGSSITANSRDLGRPPQSIMPERFVLLSPEDNFLQALILHSAPPPGESRPITDSRLGDVTSYASPEDLDQLEQKLPSLGPARLNDWVQHQQQLQLYTKQKRLSQLSQMQQQKQRYMPMVGQKVAQKRWWGGRPQRGQIDRRASQNKHLDCLKSCIKQGTLHPIQCHTLC